MGSIIININVIGNTIMNLYKNDPTFAAYVDAFSHYDVVKTEGDMATRQMMHDLIMDMVAAKDELGLDTGMPEYRNFVAQYIHKNKDRLV